MEYLKKIFELIKFWILFIWSYSPVLALTDDNNFGTIECRAKFKDNVKETRISLLNLMLGNRLLYILSYNLSSHKIDIFLIHSLEDSFVISDDEIAGIRERYQEHLINEAKENDILDEKESLIYHIAAEERRIEKSGEKVNIYTTIILTVVPLLIALGDLNKFYKYNLLSRIMSLAVIYCFVNIMIYIFQSIKIQAIIKSKFSDLRSSYNHQIELNLQYQCDWQYLKRKANLCVSYVKNLQIWIVMILVLSSIIALYNSESSYNPSNPMIQNVEKETVINLYINELDDPYSSTSIELTKLKLDIQQNIISRVYIISLNQDVSEKVFLEIKNTYKNIKVKYFADESLDINTIKIITEE